MNRLIFTVCACVMAALLASCTADTVKADAPPLAGAIALPAMPQAIKVAQTAVDSGVAASLFPGAAYAAGVHDAVAVRGASGSLGYDGEPAPTPDGTLYDLASITKAVTAVGAMTLVEDGKLHLSDPVSMYLPVYGYGAKSGVTVEMLLAHTSGLPGYAPANAFDGMADNPGKVRAVIEAMPLEDGATPGAAYHYSSVGYAVLWDVIGVASGVPTEQLLQERVFGPLGMASAAFAPSDVSRVAPNTSDRNVLVEPGRNQDRIAWYLHGLAGDAGLFGTADDMGRFAAMLSNGGTYAGHRIVDAHLLSAWTTPTAQSGGQYGLGFSTNAGGLVPGFSPVAFGHEGWTGGAVFADPVTGAWAVLVTNRTYAPAGHSFPDDQQGRINTVFGQLAATVSP